MLCVKCKKRQAVLFVTKIENNNQTQEGYCMQCARELNIGPINQIMENIGYDKDYVRRRFVANLGMTPLEYLTSLRIENAKKLLSMRTKMETSIAEIGSMCGYFDGNYFSRVFKKHVGITPEEYSKLTK